jgi:hypothetical protein
LSASSFNRQFKKIPPGSFQEYRYIFAWSYTEMPDLDPSIVEQQIDT